MEMSLKLLKATWNFLSIGSIREEPVAEAWE
jgi:hypothetical protein